MPIPAQRKILPPATRNFGRFGDAIEAPPLTDVQTRSYDRFLQLDALPSKRTPTGLEGVLREIFPIESYDKTINLEYLRYELGKPRYDPDECRQLRLTYGRPFRVWLRLNKEQPVEEEVYLGDMPIMIGGREFIINGAERVVVSQLHRSPGVDYVVETEAGERKLHSARIIPERGSWIEVNVTKKETLGVRIDQSGKFSAMTLLRAMDPAYSSDEQIIEAFYTDWIQNVRVAPDTQERLEGALAVGDGTLEALLRVGGDADVLDPVGVEGLDDLLVAGVGGVHGAEQGHGGELAALVDADAEGLLLGDVDLDPGAALRDDAGGVELALAGLGLDDVIDARR